MIPMALGTGPGAASRAGMAKVILGGQALSLLLTLLVTPVAYSLFDSLGQRLGRLRRRAAKPGVPHPVAGPHNGELLKDGNVEKVSQPAAGS
jgi:HAE1 family hydrophobic/amphiphilic exporter-1